MAFSVFWLLAGGANGPGAMAQEDDGFEVSANSFVIMDAKTGKVLLALNPQLFLPPASTLKVMTAMSVVEHLKMDDQVPVSPQAAAAPASKINIKPGEVYTVRELLYALLLSSANDAARALAEKVSGSEEAFARQTDPGGAPVGGLPHHPGHRQRLAGGQPVLHRRGPGHDVQAGHGEPGAGQDHGHQVSTPSRETGNCATTTASSSPPPWRWRARPATPGPPNIPTWACFRRTTRPSSSP